MTHYRALQIALAIGLLSGCAAGSGAPTQTTAGPSHPLGTRVLSDAVLVLPANEITVEGVSPAARDSLAVLGAYFDAELQNELQPHVSPAWMWADAVRALHRRNPLSVPDPSELSTRELRGARLREGEIVSPDLGSQLRALLAVAGARRYVLLPLRLHAATEGEGRQVGGVTLVLVDTRRSMIAGVHRLRVQVDGAGAAFNPQMILNRVAQMVRTQLAGSEPR